MDPVLTRLLNVIAETGAEQPEAASFRLPTERALAQRLNVQRSTVRERLSALEYLGILNRTQGRGTYVSPPSGEVIRWYFDLALTLGYVGADEIQTARVLLEREIVRHAAIVATPEDIDALDDLAQRMQGETDPQTRVGIDHEFHTRLALAARNPVICLITAGLASVVRRVLAGRHEAVRSIPEAAQKQDAVHPPIVEAIRAHDPDRAVAAMDAHFRVLDELFASVSTQLPEGAAPPPERRLK